MAIEKAVNAGTAKRLDYITEVQKKCLLQSALGLTFTSLYEGFGLPITEAFASGLPVITSNCTSMPEVAGNAALIVDPFDISQMTDALLNLIEDTGLAKTLKDRGLIRSKLFSWKANADRTRSIYRELI
jgi:alpha-1,3-rhamnosyl/mannosyltransferase